jgi:hypothetical protein
LSWFVAVFVTVIAGPEVFAELLSRFNPDWEVFGVELVLNVPKDATVHEGTPAEVSCNTVVPEVFPGNLVHAVPFQ